MGFRSGFIALLLLVGFGGAAPARAPEPAAPALAPLPGQSADSTQRGMSLQAAEALADTLLARRGGSHAENARLYLTWDAPWGMPRASRTHTPHAHDPAAEDTLWLCFLPGRTSPGFLGFTADLGFRAAPGDTLGPWWHLDGKGVNKGELAIDFGPDPTFPQAQPWATGGYGGGFITRTSERVRVTIVFAVSFTEAVPANPDSVYTLCRVRLHHHRVLPGCLQPVCVEWENAGLAYWLKDSPIVTAGQRFVSYASDTSVCAGYPQPAAKNPAAHQSGPSSTAPPRGHGH